MNDQGKPSGLYVLSGHLGAALGIAAAIFLSPVAFRWTGVPIYRYLARQFGGELAEPLTWVMGGVEVYLIYAVSRIALTFGAIWLLTKLATRGLR